MGSNVRGGGTPPGKQFTHTYQDIISVENLLLAWKEFVQGKRKKQDVQEFQHRLMDNLLALHTDLASGTYTHGPYHAFRINDPKQRDIHKASVRDRLVHHAMYRILYPHFDTTFIPTSYSCRVGKGTHKALDCFRAYAYKASQNHTRTCFVLKCDIKKFFASVDHLTLIHILEKTIQDADVLTLLTNIITSFSTVPNKGLPLGNLTSQLLVNIYMNEFDTYVKHTLKAKHYIRYADDFVILHHSKTHLEQLLPKISCFLHTRLYLTPHPNKVRLATLTSGIDFLGWVHFPTHRVLRTSTKKRMLRRVEETEDEATVQSYLGLLSHGDGYGVGQVMLQSREE